MNKTFRSVWNARKRTWVAVAEITHAKGKPASGVQLGAMLAVVLGGVWGLNALAQTAPPPNALPTGGQVSAGQASIRQSGAQMVIDQSSDRAAIQWQSFHLGANAQLQFNQPGASSVVLNRVLSSDPSQIFGRISANGQVILTNPQGVYFGPSARVDVGGLIATTHSIGDADFMAGKTRLERKGSTARVVNEGQLKAALGGYIALLAPEVRNEGAVIAQMGTAALAAGEALDLHFDSSNRLVSIRATPSQIQALVDNRMAVQAPGGLIILSAQSLDQLVGGVVRNSGTVEATGLQMQGGRIVLSGSHSVEHTGTIDASSAEAGGSGGRISLQGRHIALEGTSRLLATGPAGGGTVLVGGDWQGRTDPLLQATAQPTQTATTVNMAQGARIDASATHSGDGGQVVLFSDLSQDRGWTVAKGSLQAEGGPQGGNGGQIETSGHALDLNEVQVSTRAPQGRNGTWLLDPYNITISSGTQTAVDSSYSATGTGATVNVSTLVNALNNSGSVVVSTGPAGSAGADLGDITVSSAISWSSANALTLTAARNIVVNAAVSSTLSGDITFNAGGTVSGSGNIQIGPTSGAVPSPRPMLTLNPGSGSGTLSGTISGYGQLIKTGLGTVQLDGANTYSGGTSIRAGTLAVVGNGAGATYSNSVYALGGIDAAVEVQSGATLSLTNVVSNWIPMSLTLSGQGTINLISNGSDKYANLLTPETTENGRVSSFAGTLNVSGNGFNGLRHSNLSNAKVNVTTTGYGLFMTTGKSMAVGELSGNGNITAASGSLTGTLVVGALNTHSIFTGTLIDPLTLTGSTEKLALTKVGTGTLTLSGTNSYTGTTTVSAGTLLFTQPSALYNNVEASWTASNISVASGATLALGVGTGQFTAAKVGRIAALGSASGGFRSGSNVGFDTSAGDFTYGTAVNNTNAGANAIGLTKLGTGKLTLTAGNSNYSGATTVSGGTLALFGSGSVASSSGVALSGAAVFDISATTSGASIVSLSGTSTAATGVALGSKNLTVTNASGSFGGVIGGTGGLILSAGTLTLTGANSYGTTSVTGGTLQIGNTGTTGTLGNGAVTLSNNATLSFVRSTGTTIGNTISGVGHVTASITGASSDLTVSSAISLDSGTIDLAADRHLTVSANLNITGAGNITLNAGMSTIAGTSSGGDISVTGTPTISVGASGLARLFTGSIAGSSLTHLPALSGSSGLGRFRYNSDESITHYSSALGTGLHVIYREAPQITLQANLSKTYDGQYVTSSGLLTAAGSVNVTSGTLYNGDTVNAAAAGATFTFDGSAQQKDFKSGGYTIAGSLTGSSALGYGVSFVNGSLAIAKANLTQLSASKTYDGLSTVSFSQMGTVTGIHGESFTATAGTAVISDKNVATPGKSITDLSGLTLSGNNAAALADNYNLASGLPAAGANNTATIVRANLSLAAVTDTKTYDGTTSSSGTVAVTGKASTDTVTVTQAFANKNVLGAGLSTLQVNNGYTIVDGNNADMSGNYTVLTSTAAGSITKANLNLSAVTDTKTYDGTTSSSGTVVVTGKASTDTVTASQSFANKNVLGAGLSTLQVNNGYTIVDGSNADMSGNYTVLTSTASGTITAKALTISGITAANKTYDGNTSASVSTSGVTAAVLQAGGLVANDDVTVSATGSFADKHVGAAKAVALSSSYGGADLGNYTITDQATTTASITPRTVTVSGITASNKTYDGGTTATVSTTAVSFNNLVSGDALTVSATGSFDDKHVGAAKAVALSSSYGGADLGNYTITDQATTTASITPRTVTVSGITASNKTYDGGTTATVNTTAVSFNNLVAGDALTISATGSFADKHVGAAKTVALSSSYGGADAGNYNVLGQTSTTADITAKALTISGITAANKTYDGSTSASVSTSGVTAAVLQAGGLVANDDVTVSATGSFADKHVGAAKTVALSSSYGGADAGNYTITDQATTTASITPRTVTVSGITASNKTYDGGTTATVSTTAVSFNNLVAGDALTVSATGSFADKHVDAAKAVALSSSYGGADLGNYTITDQANASASIMPRALSASLTGSVGKTYDSATTAILSPAHFSLGGFVANEGATVSQTSGTYASANVDANPGSGTVSAVLLSSHFSAQAGTLLSNYILPTAASGNVGLITPAALTLKVNNTSAFVTQDANTAIHNGYSYSGLQGADTATEALVQVPQHADRTYTGTAHPVVGTYTGVYGLNQTPSAKHGNYAVSVVPGDLTVVPADQLLISIASVSETYGHRTAANAGAANSVTVQYCLNTSNCNGPNLYSLTMSGNTSRWRDNTNTTVQFDTQIDSAGQLSGGGFLKAGNYSWSVRNVTTSTPGQFSGVSVNSGVLTIDRLTITPTVAAVSKTYDGSTAADASAWATSQIKPGDALSINAGSGSYSTSNVIANDTVTFGSMRLEGADRANYALPVSSVQTSGSITPRAVTVSGITATDKTYDGTTTATVNTAAATFNNLVAGDDLSVSATGAFADKHAGNAKTVSLTSSYSGTDLSNYTITGQTSTTASISPKALTISGITAADKTYDGNAMATVSTSGVTASVLQAGGLVTGDDVSVSATGTFRNANNTADDKSAGAGKTVALSSRLGGADAGNYTITGQTRTTASITPRAVTVSGITAANKIYDGTTTATVNTASATFNNLVAGDDLSVTATGVFADMNAGTDKTVSLTSSYSGADLNNYTITDQTSTTASIVYTLAMKEPTQILNPVNLTVRASLLPAFSSSATVRTDLLSQLNEGELHKASALSNITTRTLPAESTYSNTPDTPNPAKGSDASQSSGSTISTSPTPIAGTGAASRNMDAPNRQESSAAPHNATPAGRPSPLEPGGPGASETAPLQIFTVFAPTAGGTDRPFDIPLPSAVMELLQSEGNVRASLRGMRGLPAWLSFDKEKWVLKAKRVPDNAFPLEVILTAGSKRVMLLVQRSTSRS